MLKLKALRLEHSGRLMHLINVLVTRWVSISLILGQVSRFNFVVGIQYLLLWYLIHNSQLAGRVTAYGHKLGNMEQLHGSRSEHKYQSH